MAGMGEARAIEHGFGDRIGDDGARAPRVDQSDGAGDRLDRRGRIGWIGPARLADDPAPPGERPAAPEAKDGARLFGLGFRDLDREAKPCRPAAQQIGIGQHEKRLAAVPESRL